MKQCTKCKEWKSFSEFTKKKRSKDGYSWHCKKCLKEELKNYLNNMDEYQLEHLKLYRKKYQKDNQAKYSKKYYNKNRKRVLLQQKEYHKSHPWTSHFSSIKSRCNNPKHQAYRWYGGKGIECFLTFEEIKQLWFRDKAYLLKQPSIDRKDSDGNYEFSNCRFLELSDNIARTHKKGAS